MDKSGFQISARTVVQLAFVIAVSGCAVRAVSPFTGSKVPDERVRQSALTQPGADKGLVIITRDQQSFESVHVAKLCKVRLQIDDQELAIINSNERIDVYLAPGRHVLRMANDVAKSLCAWTVENITYFEATHDRIVVLRITYAGIPQLEEEKRLKKEVKQGLISETYAQARLARYRSDSLPVVAVICSISEASEIHGIPDERDFRVCPSELAGRYPERSEVTCGCLR